MRKLTRKIIGAVAFTLIISTSTFAQKQENRERPERPPSIEKIFKDLDKNEDEKLSLKEVKGPLKNDFKKIDLNNDGFITKKELKKAPKPKRQRN